MHVLPKKAKIDDFFISRSFHLKKLEKNHSQKEIFKRKNKIKTEINAVGSKFTKEKSKIVPLKRLIKLINP